MFVRNYFDKIYCNKIYCLLNLIIFFNKAYKVIALVDRTKRKYDENGTYGGHFFYKFTK